MVAVVARPNLTVMAGKLFCGCGNPHGVIVDAGRSVLNRTVAPSPARKSATLAAIVESFDDERRPGLSKIAQLYNAIVKLTHSGRLTEGTKLPGERELSAALKISLGTAQKSLHLLMTDGEILREHGRGTYVRGSRQALNHLWHYRFRDPASGEIFPVYAKLIDRMIVRPDSAVMQALGVDGKGYIRVRRLISIADRFTCWSEMFLGASRFGRLLTFPISDVESINLKQILREKFNAPTLAVQQTVKMQIPARAIAKQIGLPPREPCMLQQIVATGRRREPITFQKIYVPPVDYEMEIDDGPGDAARALAA
jgi:DNA-binding GntR family transcriptional regulator